MKKFVERFGPYKYFGTIAFQYSYSTQHVNQMFNHVINVSNAKIKVKKKNQVFGKGHIKGAAFIEYSTYGAPHIHYLISQDGKIGDLSFQEAKLIMNNAACGLTSTRGRKLIHPLAADFQAIYNQERIISYCCKTLHRPNQKGKYSIIDSKGPLPFS